MAIWLQQNAATIVMIAVLALLVFLAVRKMVRDKKAGIGACGNKCAECARRSACHQNESNEQQGSR